MTVEKAALPTKASFEILAPCRAALITAEVPAEPIMPATAETVPKTFSAVWLLPQQ